MQTNESKILTGEFKIEVFKEYEDGVRQKVNEIVFRNQVTNIGGALTLDALIGSAITPFSNANAHIGIGNGATAVSVSHTDLQGASKTRKAMNATFPSRNGQVMTFKATFGTSDANYIWNEIALFNASSNGSMFSRQLIADPFTKTSALSVDCTYTLTCP